jgi:hypothetical protein
MSFTVTDDLEPPRMTPAVRWLISINVVVYFLQMTMIDRADIQAGLGFHVRDLTDQWWTVLTYMFVHGNFLHIFFNMYALWLFGRRVELRGLSDRGDRHGARLRRARGGAPARRPPGSAACPTTPPA